jgi:hypothetical protein
MRKQSAEWSFRTVEKGVQAVQVSTSGDIVQDDLALNDLFRKLIECTVEPFCRDQVQTLAEHKAWQTRLSYVTPLTHSITAHTQLVLATEASDAMRVSSVLEREFSDGGPIDSEMKGASAGPDMGVDDPENLYHTPQRLSRVTLRSNCTEGLNMLVEFLPAKLTVAPLNRHGSSLMSAFSHLQRVASPPLVSRSERDSKDFGAVFADPASPQLSGFSGAVGGAVGAASDSLYWAVLPDSLPYAGRMIFQYADAEGVQPDPLAHRTPATHNSMLVHLPPKGSVSISVYWLSSQEYVDGQCL